MAYPIETRARRLSALDYQVHVFMQKEREREALFGAEVVLVLLISLSYSNKCTYMLKIIVKLHICSSTTCFYLHLGLRAYHALIFVIFFLSVLEKLLECMGCNLRATTYCQPEEDEVTIAKAEVEVNLYSQGTGNCSIPFLKLNPIRNPSMV